MLDRLGVVSIWVTDFPRALAFYRDALGLPLSDMPPDGESRQASDWVRFELKGAAIELFDLARNPKRAERTPSPRQNANVLCFIVDDFDAVYEGLKARGVPMQPARQAEWGRYAHFRDPEGNELQIYQPKPGY
ncbi:MAG: VOC family protein [Anaerolineae bacterium]